MVKITLNVPEKIYSDLRKEAYLRKRSMTSIIVESLTDQQDNKAGIGLEEVSSEPDYEPEIVNHPPVIEELCKHGKSKTNCTIAKCENYASWR